MLISPVSIGYNKNITLNGSSKSSERNAFVDFTLCENTPFLDCSRMDLLQKWSVRDELVKLNEFAKEANKEIILISKKHNLVVMKMRPLKKDSTFFTRLFGLDTSEGYYYTNNDYSPIALAALLLKDQKTSVDSADID